MGRNPVTLAYAMAHPQAGDGTRAAGSFRRAWAVLRWFFQDLAEHCPAAWQALAAGVEEGERAICWPR